MEENRPVDPEQTADEVTPVPEEEAVEVYKPRPRWQVWAAWIGLVIFILFVIYQIYNLATGGQNAYPWN